jgi:EAL domain-containing protein (putative c-di-GMP-specific phosphodiesterase class I)
MEAELRLAIESGEVGTWFQPQICLASGSLAGVEALARWTRPDGTIVPPSDFVPLSEEMGISDLLFESIMRYVCVCVARWRKSLNWSVPVSVNLSAHQLRNHDLLPLIRGILQQQNVEQKFINLELTETTLLEDLTIAKPLLRDLANFGVGIHIDDFGTGYSSLSYLAELPVKTLKIDRTFTERITESPTNARVVQAIIALGKAMNLDVIAEGVETEQQLLLVNQFGCDLAQGFFIGQPMPEEDFIRWCNAVEDTGSELAALSATAATRLLSKSAG